MSYYEDDRRRASTRTVDRRGNDSRRSDYYDDDSTVYENTRSNTRSTALVRRDSDNDSVEEIRRERSPGGGYYRETTIRKSGTRPIGGRNRSYDDDDRYYEDDRSTRYSSRQDSYYAGGRSSRGSDRRDDRRRDDSSSSRSRTPPRRERRKSMGDQALEALGLGGVVAKLTGRDRSREGGRDRERGPRSRSEHQKQQVVQAVQAAVISGAVAAFRSRKEPGGWQGEKGKRVITAALTSGAVDGLINQHGNPDRHKLVDTVGAVLAGVAANRVVNGPRSQSRGRNGSPGRRRGGGGVGEAAAGGGLALAAKNIYDRVRSKSRGGDGDRRGRSRSRSDSYDSYDSRSPPRRSRSRSFAGRALSTVGLNNQADRVDPAGARDRSRARSRSRAGSRYDDRDSYYDDRDNVSRSRSPRSRSLVPSKSAGSRDLGSVQLQTPNRDYHYTTEAQQTGDPETDSESDLGHSSDDEKIQHKGRRRLAIAGGLATVATIHAGHSIYQFKEKRDVRKEALRDGTISKEEAEKHKMRDRLQEVASVGLAALGIKGAYSEWKEMKEKKEEWDEQKEAAERHARKRELRRRKSDMAQRLKNQYGGSMPNLYSGHSPGYAETVHTMSPQPDHHNNQVGYNQGPYAGGARNDTQYFDDNPYSSAYAPQQAPQQYDTVQPQPQVPYQNPYAPGARHDYNPYSQQMHAGYTSPPFDHQPTSTGFPPPPGAHPPPPQAQA